MCTKSSRTHFHSFCMNKCLLPGFSSDWISSVLQSFDLCFPTLSTSPGFVSCISEKHYGYIRHNHLASSTVTIMLCLKLKTLIVFGPQSHYLLTLSTSECTHHLSTPKYFQQNPKKHPNSLFHQFQQLHLSFGTLQ